MMSSCCFFVQEEDAEAERVKEERLKAYQEKKSKSKPSVMFILHLKNKWYINVTDFKLAAYDEFC